MRLVTTRNAKGMCHDLWYVNGMWPCSNPMMISYGHCVAENVLRVRTCTSRRLVRENAQERKFPDLSAFTSDRLVKLWSQALDALAR